jgi:hypothetical protein
MNLKNTIFVITCISLFIISCSRIIVPPTIDLKPYQAISIIKFNCTEKGNLADFVTQKFIEEITKDQKPIQILELGNEADILAAIQQTTMDPDAYKAIGAKYNVRSIVIGNINISDIKPEISIAPGLSFVGARGVVEASFVAHMFETTNGATIWTGSARDKQEVGSISIIGGHFMFDAKDPEEAYGPLAEALVKKATKDFKETWKWSRSCF